MAIDIGTVYGEYRRAHCRACPWESSLHATKEEAQRAARLHLAQGCAEYRAQAAREARLELQALLDVAERPHFV